MSKKLSRLIVMDRKLELCSRPSPRPNQCFSPFLGCCAIVNAHEADRVASFSFVGYQPIRLELSAPVKKIKEISGGK